MIFKSFLQIFSVYDQEETLANGTCLYIFKSDHMSLFMLYHLGLILKKIVINFSVSLGVHHVFERETFL